MATQWSVIANRKDKRGQVARTEYRIDAVTAGGCPAQAGALVLLDSCGKIDSSLLPPIPSSSCCIELEVNGVKVPDQNTANFIAQNNIEITYDNAGGIYFNVTGTPSSCAEYLCTPSGCPIDVGLSAPTHPGMMLISQPGNCSAIWADPQVQGLYPAGSPICPAPAYVAPTCIQPIGIGIQDANGDLQWLQGSFAGSPAVFALDVNVVNPLTVTFSESSICVTQCTTPWVVSGAVSVTGTVVVTNTGTFAVQDAAAEASLATLAADLASVIGLYGSPAVPVLQVEVVNQTSGTSCVTQCTSPWVVNDPIANAYLAELVAALTFVGSPAVPAINVNVASGDVTVSETYNAIPPSPPNGSTLPLQSDSAGSLYVDPTGRIPTYHGTESAFAPLANATTPFFTIQGSATKVIQITWACTTGNSALNLIRFRRFSAISGGAFNAITPVPDDTLNPAATVAISQYTTLPTVATAFNLGSIESQYMQWTTNTSSLVGPPAIVWEFGTDGGQAATLRGVNDWFGIEISAVAAAGALMTIKVMWTEE